VAEGEGFGRCELPFTQLFAFLADLSGGLNRQIRSKTEVQVQNRYSECQLRMCRSCRPLVSENHRAALQPVGEHPAGAVGGGGEKGVVAVNSST